MIRRQVYYGLSPKFIAWAKVHMFLFDDWMAQMKKLLNQEGVVYKGENMNYLFIDALIHASKKSLSKTGVRIV